MEKPERFGMATAVVSQVAACGGGGGVFLMENSYAHEQFSSLIWR